MGMQVSNMECFGTSSDVASGLQGTITEAMNGHAPSLMAVFTAHPDSLQPVLDELRRFLPDTKLVGATMPEPGEIARNDFIHAVAWAVTGKGCLVATGMADGLATDKPEVLLRQACPEIPRDLHCPNLTALLIASSEIRGDDLRAAATEFFPDGTKILHLTPREDLARTSAPVAADQDGQRYSLTVVLMATAEELEFTQLVGGVPAPTLPDHEGRVTHRLEGRVDVP